MARKSPQAGALSAAVLALAREGVTALDGGLEENALFVTVAPDEQERALALLHEKLILPQYKPCGEKNQT